jgi:hypothetical protein
MTPPPKQNLYCYVDETGQDTMGRLFIVSVVISEAERDALTSELEQIEHLSGKGKVKWIHTRHAARIAYIRAVLSAEAFRNALYFSAFSNTKSYMAMTVLSTARAIAMVARQPSEATVYVDGLPRARLRWFGVELRRLSIRTRKVVGIRREESEALMRLADACCGFVRLALSGQQPEVTGLLKRPKPMAICGRRK